MHMDKRTRDHLFNSESRIQNFSSQEAKPSDVIVFTFFNEKIRFSKRFLKAI